MIPTAASVSSSLTAPTSLRLVRGPCIFVVQTHSHFLVWTWHDRVERAQGEPCGIGPTEGPDTLQARAPEPISLKRRGFQMAHCSADGLWVQRVDQIRRSASHLRAGPGLRNND